MERVLCEGVEKRDRTGVGTRSIFGHQMRFDLQRRLSAGHHQEAARQIHHLRAAVVPARRHQRQISQRPRRHDLGRMGRRQRRSRPGLRPAMARRGRRRTAARIDQMANVVAEIRRNPDSRRLIVTAWNPAEIDSMALPPCHCLFQFNVAEGALSCQLYQRSADVFLGVPFNIASYALLTLMVAQVTGLKPGAFIHSFGDAHLYLNHLEQARLQLTRSRGRCRRCGINPAVKDLFALRYEDFVARRLRSASAHQGRGGGVSDGHRLLVAADRRERRHRPRQCAAVAAQVGHAAFPRADHGQAGGHGAQDLSLDRQAACRPHHHRGEPRPRIRRAGHRGRAEPRCCA